MKYVCDLCGKPTDNIHEWDSDVTGKHFEHHICNECDDRIDKMTDWQNEQFDETDMVCPWCGYRFESDENIYDENESECECPTCGKTIEFEIDTTIHWTTRKPERLFESEGDE